MNHHLVLPTHISRRQCPVKLYSSPISDGKYQLKPLPLAANGLILRILTGKRITGNACSSLTIVSEMSIKAKS